MPGPYVGEDGLPRLAESFVAFVDLLGTKAHRSDRELDAYLKTVWQAVQQAQARSLARHADPAAQGTIQWFSDNLAIAYPVRPEWAITSPLAFLIAECSYLQLGFAENGLFARGAIARDLFFADDAFIHGPALDRAVTLEQSRARFPRVVLDESAVAAAELGLVLEDASATGSPWRRQLLVDDDGVVFINYLAALLDNPAGVSFHTETCLRSHKRSIENNLRRYDGVDGIEEKYRWLAAYHNYFVGGGPEQLDCETEGLICLCSRPLGHFQMFNGSGRPRTTELMSSSSP